MTDMRDGWWEHGADVLQFVQGFPIPVFIPWVQLGAAGGITVERATSRGGDTNALLSQRLLTRLVPS